MLWRHPIEPGQQHSNPGWRVPQISIRGVWYERAIVRNCVSNVVAFVLLYSEIYIKNDMTTHLDASVTSWYVACSLLTHCTSMSSHVRPLRAVWLTRILLFSRKSASPSVSFISPVYIRHRYLGTFLLLSTPYTTVFYAHIYFLQ